MDAQNKLAELNRLLEEAEEDIREECSTLGPPKKTLEQALQEALDNSTPEQPGYPNPFEEDEEEEYPTILL